MSKYWKKKLYEEYGVIVKKIRHIFNPFTSWGFIKKNYIVYYFINTMFGSLIQNYDVIFHSPEEIIDFLEKRKQNGEPTLD